MLSANLKNNWFGVGVGGRGGVPGKRKTWGFEDLMSLLSDLARRTERVGGSMDYRLFRRPPTFLVLDSFVFCVFGEEGKFVQIAPDSSR